MGQSSPKPPLLFCTKTQEKKSQSKENMPENITKIMIQFVNLEVASAYIDSKITCQELKD